MIVKSLYNASEILKCFNKNFLQVFVYFCEHFAGEIIFERYRDWSNSDYNCRNAADL